MKIFTAIIALLVLVFLAYAYFHSKSIDRSHLIHSVNELLVAQKRFREDGFITNQNRGFRVYSFTNHITVGNTEFVGELAVASPILSKLGHLVATTNDVLIWVDKKHEASIVRDANHQYVIPPQFRDF